MKRPGRLPFRPDPNRPGIRARAGSKNAIWVTGGLKHRSPPDIPSPGSRRLGRAPEFPRVFSSPYTQTTLDELPIGQLEIDFVTGLPTALSGLVVSPEERATCSALNRERARGILEAVKFAPSGQSFPVDVWNATFTRRAREWSLPLISLAKLGFVREDEGLVCPPSMFALKPGAEAEPYWHRGSGMVYKIVQPAGGWGTGKKDQLRARRPRGV